MKAVFALLLAFNFAQQRSTPDIQVTNTAEYLAAGRYNWKVFLTGPPASLNAIDYVEYTLHPSFPNPVRKVNDRASNFALPSNGWGEFNIKVKVVNKNGTVKYLDHWLKLNRSVTAARPPTVQAPHNHSSITTGNTSRSRKEMSGRCRKYSAWSTRFIRHSLNQYRTSAPRALSQRADFSSTPSDGAPLLSVSK